jgi:hypothetical protein
VDEILIETGHNQSCSIDRFEVGKCLATETSAIEEVIERPRGGESGASQNLWQFLCSDVKGDAFDDNDGWDDGGSTEGGQPDWNGFWLWVGLVALEDASVHPVVCFGPGVRGGRHGVLCLGL